MSLAGVASAGDVEKEDDLLLYSLSQDPTPKIAWTFHPGFVRAFMRHEVSPPPDVKAKKIGRRPALAFF